MITKNEYEKQIAASLKPLKREDIPQETVDNIDSLFANRYNKYIMLLCHENRYYTIFNRVTNVISTKSIAERLLDFIFDDPYLKTLGDIKYIDICEEHVEIWIGELYFALFECDGFIVNI